MKHILLEHFNLFEEPFGVTPDPRFLYLGDQHREALASLAYGTESNRGFLALIAKPGMGKTSLLYRYMEGLRGKASTAFVFRTDCDSREFIRHVVLDLGIDAAGMDLPAMHDALNQRLAEETREGRRFVLVIDEAQNLDERVLESIRLLSNFETPWLKLMQIVIAGQPGLAEKLARPSLIQLRQRISSVIRILPLNASEINAYIDYRLSVAGCKDSGLFPTEARALIAEHSEGIPRKINNICFNAMSLACAVKMKTVDRAMVVEALADFDLESLIEKKVLDIRISDNGPMKISAAPQRPTKAKKAWRRPLSRRLAAASVLVLAAVSGVKDGQVRVANAHPLGDKPVEQPVTSFAELRADSELIKSSREENVTAVRVLEGQNLYRISLHRFGRYDRQISAEIHRLNPWLNDSATIRVGQQILVPSRRFATALREESSQHVFPSPQEEGENE